MDWKATLKSRGYLLSDGAWGTELAKMGLTPGEVPERWNIDHPDRVEKVARAYVRAGADIILTNTFGANSIKLARVGLASQAAMLNRRGIEISKRAAGDKALVFASVGPTGEMMAPLGDKKESDFIECFAEQISACAGGGADGIVIETMADAGEVLAAITAARQVCRLPVVASMTFDRTAKGYATMMGVTPEKAAAVLGAADADLLGANCGAGIDSMIEVAKAIRKATRRPLWVKPNAGLPQLVDGKTVFRETPEAMAAKVEALLEAGANVIGGCCGTTPEHIRRIAEAAAKAQETARRASRKVLEAL
jgi:5-methyltetrahydrofolate--homocysteine methyltransferase